MAILKLKNGKHNAITGTVAAVEMVTTGKFGPEYKITLDNGDDVFLNKAGFERQAGRLQLLPNEVAGQTLTFWKKAMEGETEDGKGYLNVDLGDTTMKTPMRGVAAGAARDDDYVGRDLRNAGVAMTATTYEAIKDTYQATLGDAVSIARDCEETLGLQFTPAEVLAMTATLYIERNRKGV